MGKIRVEDEISIPEVYLKVRSFFGFLVSKWVTLAVFVLVFTVIGVIVSINQEYRYEASQTLLTYSNSSGGNQTASRLASLAGINLPNMQGSDGQIVNEFMMPNLLSTYPVARKIGDIQVRLVNSPQPVKSIQYVLDQEKKTFMSHVSDWTIGLPGKIVNFIIELFQDEPVTQAVPGSQAQAVPDRAEDQDGNQGQILPSTPETVFPDHLVVPSFERNALNKLTSALEISVEGNMITIKAELNDPIAAADFVNGATQVLMQEVVDFQIKKTQDDLEFLEELLEEAESNYQNTLARISTLQDRNRGVTSNASQVELNVALGESELARQRYMQYLLRVEETRVRLKQDTPMFAVLNPVQIPVDPINANKSGVVMLYIFLGLFLGAGFVTVRGFLNHLKLSANSSNG